MIIGDRREEVIENIKKALENETYSAKVELSDPVITKEESDAIVNRYLENSKKFSFKLKSFVARRITNLATTILNKDTEIVGLENLKGLEGGAVVTCNHFSPLDNTCVRYLVHNKLKRKRINIVSQETNFLMPGILGFLLNYSDVIPISGNKKYLTGEFMNILEGLVSKGEYVLIYPEQEMWFNFRKPRPIKRGAYYYAAKLRAPIIPCFIEMIDKDEIDKDNFLKVKYRLHILPVIYPDKSLSEREDSARMCEADYTLKKEVYERVYQKELTYDFSHTDIAGYIPQKEESEK